MEGKLEKAQIQHLTDFNNKYGKSTSELHCQDQVGSSESWPIDV